MRLANGGTAFQYASSATGASVDEREKILHALPFHDYICYIVAVKLIASFLLSYPLAGVLKRIPDANPYQKNSFIIMYIKVSSYPRKL